MLKICEALNYKLQNIIETIKE
ncbi:hypothetical protein [Candidatus Arthromitus sp. SFB-rat-Yit]